MFTGVKYSDAFVNLPLGGSEKSIQKQEGQLCLYNEFQANWLYIAKILSLKTNKIKTTTNKKYLDYRSVVGGLVCPASIKL